MIERIEGAPPGVLAFSLIGTVTADDYRDVLAGPVAEAAAAGKVRIVVELGPRYEGYSAGAALEDVKLWMPRLTKWERCGVVTDHSHLAGLVRTFAPLMPGEIRVFPVSELAAALTWASE